MTYKVFIIYAREDAAYLQELRGQLRPLEKAGRISVWSDREINPGVDWERAIIHNLDTADMILLMVSAAYYNSVYIHEKEIQYALARHEKGEARVLPIIVRPCSFLDDPEISRLQVLPSDGKPVTDKKYWNETDLAWLDVVSGIKKTLDAMDAAAAQEAQAQKVALEQKKLEEARKKEQERLALEAAADAKAREAARAAAQEEQQRNEQRRQALEAEYRKADQNAWQTATEIHDIPAYEAYIAQFPNGAMLREARARIKDLKKQNAAPIPWQRYAGLGGGGAALLLALWWVAGMFNPPQKQAGPGNFQGNPPQQAQVDTVRPEYPSDAQPEEKKQDKEELKVKNERSLTFDYPTIYVQGGTYQMGSPASEKDRFEVECQHQVTVGAFNLGKYEVSQAQWKLIMGTNPSAHKSCPDCPVENVSWNDVQEFIKKLEQKTGKKYRLPTEKEWEWAARGGVKSKNYTYAGSNSLESVAWYSDNSSGNSHPIGKKAPNDLGLYDMSGNVWEWCQDYYAAYPYCKGSVDNGRLRVLRGGSWYFSARLCRSACRYYNEPGSRNGLVGFRLVSVSL